MKFTKYGMVFGAFLFCLSAFAGTRDGGGGVGVRCLNPDGSGSFELLDIHEGVNRGLSFPYSLNSNAEISDFAAKTAIAQLRYPFERPVPEEIVELKTKLFDRILDGSGFMMDETGKFIFITNVEQLPLSKDVGNTNLRTGCHLEQIAYFDDDRGILFFAKPNWDELSGLNKAALLLHELIYLKIRMEGLEYAGVAKGTLISSEKSRQFVAAMLSIQGLMPKYYGIPESAEAIHCYDIKSDDDHPTGYFIIDSGPKEVTFVLDFTNGLFSPYSVRVTVSGVSTQDLLKPGNLTVHQKLPVIFDGEDDPPAFTFELTMAPQQAPQVVISRNLQGNPFVIGSTEVLQCRVGNSDTAPPVVVGPISPKPNH